jgi:hypothetical protein
MNSLEIATRIATAQYVSVTEEALTIDHTDGRTVLVALGWYAHLLHGTPEESEYWHLIEQREDIRWPDLYEDISVDNLVLGKPSGESQCSFKLWPEACATPTEQT